MVFIPLTARAKNWLREHTLGLVCPGVHAHLVLSQRVATVLKRRVASHPVHPRDRLDLREPSITGFQGSGAPMSPLRAARAPLS